MKNTRYAMALAAAVVFTIADPALGSAQKVDPGKKLERAQAARILTGLQQDGWRPADKTTFDAQATLLRPEALLANPARARAILASVAVGRNDVDGIGEVARKTTDPVLREAAIQSIGKVSGARAQSELVELYRAIPDSAAKGTILRALRPAREDDAAATLLYQEAANPALATTERTVALRSLASLGIRRFGVRSASAPSEISSRLPLALRGQFAELYGLARNGAKAGDTLVQTNPHLTRVPLDSNKVLQDSLHVVHADTIYRKVGTDGKNVAAPASQVNQPGTYRQVLIMPAGFTSEERGKYFSDVDKMINNMGNLKEPVYTRKYRDRIVYVIHWIPGGVLGSPTANFRAKTYPHPTRRDANGNPEKGMTLKNPEVIAAVRNLKQSKIPSLDPIGVIVLMNRDEPSIAYASPPTLLQQKFGIVRLSRHDIDAHHNRPMHELAHASLNFLDEYIEPALVGQDITDFDLLTPAILPDGSWGSLRDSWESLIGNYEIRFSDILADNGSGNISTRKHPATVVSSVSGYTPFKYEFEGGMFFEFGTFHDSGNNVMNVDRTTKGGPLKPSGDRHALNHSPSQHSVIDHVFGATGTPRPNDRLRNAGPTIAWAPQLGSSVRLLLFDADKNHRWHPTSKYEVQVGWWEWVYQGTFFDPLKGEFQFKSMRREFTPSVRTVDLSKTFAAGGASVLRDALVFLGVQELSEGGFNLAALTVDELLNGSIPSVVWPTPYQDVQVSLPVPNIYYWRFRTYNGTHWSGFTEYSTFSKL